MQCWCWGSVELTWECLLASLYKINSFVIANQSQVFVLTDDRNFCLSSLHWALIGQLPPREIWPTNDKLEGQFCLSSLKMVNSLCYSVRVLSPGPRQWLQYCQLFRPTLTTGEQNLMGVSCSQSVSSRGPVRGSWETTQSTVCSWNCFDRWSPFEKLSD